MIPNFRSLYLSVKERLLTKTLTDEFLSWLSFANAGMLHRGNAYLIDHAIRRLPSDKPILEIGSFCGLSTNVIAHLLAKHGRTARIVTCDKWLFEGAEGGGTLAGSTLTHEQYRAFVMSTYRRNVEFFAGANKPYTVELTSDEFFAAWRKKETLRDVFGRDITLGGQVSFCYIDGNHTYEFANRDFQNTHEILEPGGFILFDDSSDGDPFGLTRLMREVQRRPDYELVLKNPNYLFRKAA